MADRRRRRIAAATGAVALGLAGVVAVLDAGEDRQWSRQAAVAARGAHVMPFDLDATTHRFVPDPTGGIQSVVADDPRDRAQVALIRRHLRDERDRFAVGDFGDPAEIHGHDMPGLAVLVDRFARLAITFRALEDGAALTYRSDDRRVVAALHDWFAAQIADHGAHAETG